MQKVSLFDQFILENTAVWVPWPKEPHTFSTTKKNHDSIILIILAFLNLYQHTKNQFIPLIPSWDTANFTVLWPEW